MLLDVVEVLLACFDSCFRYRFPTLYWVPKNRKDKPEPYTGGREVDDFIKYIAKHATEELKGYKRDGKPKKKEEL